MMPTIWLTYFATRRISSWNSASTAASSFISEAVEKILNRPASHFVGRSFLEVIIPEDREHTLSVFQKVVTTGIEPLVRFRVLRSDALRVELETSIRVFQRDGTRCIVAVARDITQQSAEIAVTRQRDDYYRTLVESGSRPSAIIDRKGEVLFSNRNFKTTFAHAENLNDIFLRTPDATRHTIETAWYESSRSEGANPGGVDFNYIHDDESTSWYAVSWNAFADEDGERRFTCVYEDITPRKRVEIALRSVAEGVGVEGADGIERNIHLVAQALGFERFIVASISPEDPGFATIYAGVEHGHALDKNRIELHDLPDLAVSRGETCVFPSGVARLVPSVAEFLSPTYESYAGVPLRRGDGQVIGFVSGYSSAIAGDTELTRSLLTASATQAAAFSDRRRANEEIRATEDRFRVLAAQAHEILVEVDQEGTVLYASAASDFILGYTPEDMLGKSIPRLVHPEDREKNRASQARLFSGEDEHSFVVNRVLHADGHWRWLESRTSSFIAPDGSPRALILSRDITDQRHQELGRELLYRVVQSGADLVFVCETDTRLVFANEPAMRRLSAHSQGIRRNNDGTPEKMAPLNAGIDATSIDANNVEGRRLDELLTEADS